MLTNSEGVISLNQPFVSLMTGLRDFEPRRGAIIIEHQGFYANKLRRSDIIKSTFRELNDIACTNILFIESYAL